MTRTVRVAWAPQGKDFDDLIREEGDQAFMAIAAIIDSATTPLRPDIPARISAPKDKTGGARKRDAHVDLPSDPDEDRDDAPVPPGAAGAAAPSAAAPASADPPIAPAAAPLRPSAENEKSSRMGSWGGNGGGKKGGGGDPFADDAEFRLNMECAWLPQTDLGNVERFVKRYRDKIKWCGALGWLYWDGKRWSRRGAESYVIRAEHDTVRAIQAEARAAERAAGDVLNLLEYQPTEDIKITVAPIEQLKAKLAGRHLAKARKTQKERLVALADTLRAWGRKSEGAAKMAPLAKRAKGNIDIHHEELDADPFLINVANGTLVVRRPDDTPETDLPLIVLKAHDPADLITKLAPVKFDPDATCSDFLKFFTRVQPSERQRRFLQQWHGYSLTGDAEEQKFVVNWGQGRNGKGTFVETIAHIAGDYADSVPIETFLQSGAQKSGGQATPDLAKLPGIRFLRAGEPERGAKLAEALIKRVTGGDPIDARNLNKEFFTFFPQFKFELQCNHQPRIGGSDDGIWGRVIKVPWPIFIPAPERDPQLKTKLRAEGSGILNWLLDGLRDWLRNGLVLGEEITEATAKYRRDSDAVGRFLDFCTVADPDPKVRVQSSVLYEVYCAWAKCNDGPNYSNKGFSGILQDRGYDSVQSNVMWWMRLRLIKTVNDFVDHEGKPLTSAGTRDDRGKSGGSDDEPSF